MKSNNYSKNNIRQLFLYLFPVQYFSFVATSLGQLINGLFVGNLLSSLDMVALGFYNPFQIIISVFSTVVSGGSRIVCGTFIGRGNKEKINESFTCAISLLLVLGLIITSLSLFCAPTIATLIGASEASFEKTVTYIRTMGIGLSPDMLSMCLMVFLQMENESNYSLYAVLVLAVSNLILDFVASKVLVFNIFIVGIVSSISKYIALLFIIRKFITKKSMPKLTKVYDKKLYLEIIRLGLPAGIFNVLVGLRNIEINKASLIYGGDNAVNALSILGNSESIYDGVSVAVGNIITMLASIYYGEKDRGSIKKLFKVAVIYGELITLIRVAVIVLFTDKIALLYGAAPEIIDDVKNLYLIYGIAMPFNILILGYMNTYQALGKVTYCNVIYFITVFLLSMFCCRVVSIKYGLFGAWFSYILEEIAIFILVYAYALIVKKKNIFNLEEVLFFDNEIDVGKHLSISVNNINDALTVSSTIEKYCISEGVDKRRAMLSGLCLEEISTNIIEHGFSSSKRKNKTIDIYCDVDDDTKVVNLRIKDNAKPFDPHIKLQNNNDITSNVGIRLVSKIAKEMNYQNDFGLNVLTIKL